MYKQVIILRSDLSVGKGKLAAHAAHASLEAYKKADSKARAHWEEEGATKVVVKVASEKELLTLYNAVKKALPSALIRDAGKTQIPAGTLTAVAAGPADAKLLDKYTKHLKLL